MPVSEIRESLAPLRRPLSIGVIRSKNAFNIGSIIRVAHSFLVTHIVLVGDEPFYKRAAMGMQKYENLGMLPDDDALIGWAREKKLPLVCFEREPAKTDLWHADLPGECLMVFGSENEGVSQTILDAADDIVAIPMFGINNSYPITVASGIAIAEWTRRYYGKGDVG